MATRDADYYRELGRRSAQKRIAEHGTAHLKAIAPLGGQALRESPLRRNGGLTGGPALLAQRGVEHFRRAKLAAMANERGRSFGGAGCILPTVTPTPTPLTDSELERWLFDDAADWPTQGFRLYPHVEIPDPGFWRERLRAFWQDERARPRILADLRQMRRVLAEPIAIREGYVDNAGAASGRAYREAEEQRRKGATEAAP